jgi:DNA-binding beta-propeller fold protein YncE
VLLVVALQSDVVADEAECNLDIATSSEALARSHEARLKRCLKRSQNNACAPFDFHVGAAENALRALITDPGGACAAAVNVVAVPLASFGPGAVCRDAGGSASCEAEVPAITTLDELADCLICLQGAMSQEVEKRIASSNRYSDGFEARCIRSLFNAATRAARKARKAVERCARGGTQPFACPVDDAPDGKFGKALAVIDKKVARCKDVAGVPGQLGHDFMGTLCADGPSATNAELSACYADSMRCMTCLFANRVLGQSQDCIDFSGVTCHGTVAEPGMFYIANAGDGTVTFYGVDGAPVNGTAPASSFASGAGVSAVAASPRNNIVYVANAADDTVTYLDATTGAPALGTLAASTFAVGDNPVALDVSAKTLAGEPLFVVNGGGDSVTVLHPRTGRPFLGDLAASTFAVGADPRDVSLLQTIAVVTSFGTDTVTALAGDGTGYRNGTLPASTYAVGDGPTRISRLVETGYGATLDFFVANENDSSITRLNATTGIPMATTAASAAPIGIAFGATLPGIFRPVWTTTAGGDLVLYERDGSFAMTTQANATFPIAGNPTALIYDEETDSLHMLLAGTNEVATFPANLAAGTSIAPCVPHGITVRDLSLDTVNDRLYVLCGDLSTIVVLDATTPGYAFGSAAASTFDFGLTTEHLHEIEVDGAAGVVYASAIDPTLNRLEVFRIDATTGTLLGASPYVVASFESGSGFNAALAFDPGLGLLYLVDADNEAIMYLDADTLAYVGGSAAAATLSMGEKPQKLAVDGTAGGVYGINTTLNAVLYADATTVDYLGPDLAGSTLAAPFDPRDLVNNPVAGLTYVTSRMTDEVTFYDAASVAYAFGSFPSSTFAVDSGGRIGVDPASNRLYVSAGAFDFTQSVTILDATTGAYINGTLADSVFPWLATGGLVANPNDGLVLAYAADGLVVEEHIVYYNGLTGAPLVWGPNITTQATGPSPVAVDVMPRP